MGLGVSIIYCLLRCLFVVLHRLFCMKVGFKPLKGILLSAIMGLFYVTIRVIGIPTPLSESQIPRIPQKKNSLPHTLTPSLPPPPAILTFPVNNTCINPRFCSFNCATLAFNNSISLSAVLRTWAMAVCSSIDG